MSGFLVAGVTISFFCLRVLLITVWVGFKFLTVAVLGRIWVVKEFFRVWAWDAMGFLTIVPFLIGSYLADDAELFTTAVVVAVLVFVAWLNDSFAYGFWMFSLVTLIYPCVADSYLWLSSVAGCWSILPILIPLGLDILLLFFFKRLGLSDFLVFSMLILLFLFWLSFSLDWRRDWLRMLCNLLLDVKTLFLMSYNWLNLLL